jgi:hypothetical protein
MSVHNIEHFPNQQHSEYATPADVADWFFLQMRRQEEMYVEAGFPADGVTDLLKKWWDAWDSMSMVNVRECISDDIVYADPTNGNRGFVVGQPEIDLWSNLLKSVHANAYYQPLGKIPRGLPLWDFLDGNVRIALPYRAVGRFRPFRQFDIEVVDRYDLVRDPERGWLISRIDTNGDLLSFLQMLPIPIRPPSQRTVRRIQSVLQRFFPAMRGPIVRPFADPPID